MHRKLWITFCAAAAVLTGAALAKEEAAPAPQCTAPCCLKKKVASEDADVTVDKPAAEVDAETSLATFFFSQQGHHRLLPHRGTLQPHLVRPQISHRHRKRKKLRWKLDRIRQHGRCPHRKRLTRPDGDVARAVNDREFVTAPPLIFVEFDRIRVRREDYNSAM